LGLEKAPYMEGIMIHNYDELYEVRYNHKTIYCTKAFLNLNDIPVGKRAAKEQNKTLFAIHCLSLSGCAEHITVYDGAEHRRVWVYGAYKWFDTEEERDLYRVEAQKEREEFLAWNKVKKEIIAKLENKTKEELEEILARL
jgi:hypothetical protein